jgi:hypothetical protein
LIINTDLKDAGVLWHLLVRPKAVGGTIWSICHSEPRVGSFISLQIADGVVKDCLMAAAQTFFDSGCIQVAGLHPDGGRDVLTTLETYFVPPSMWPTHSLMSCTCLLGLMTFVEHLVVNSAGTHLHNYTYVVEDNCERNSRPPFHC